MKALFVERPGDPPALSVRDIPTPRPGAGEVLVEVAACGMCRHDMAVMSGLLRRGVRHDVILGHEISGRIAELGPGATQAAVGDSVVAMLNRFCGECARCASGREYRCFEGAGVGHALNGGFAEFVTLPENCIVKVPPGVDIVEAALLACPIGVVHRAVNQVAQIAAGETVLVTGASGGLGVHAIQAAAYAGARVIAVTGSSEKAEQLEARFGCESVLTGEVDFSEIVVALTEDQGVDVVIDTVGSPTFLSALRSLAQFGRMVLLGEVAGSRASFNLAELVFRDASLRASSGAGRSDVETAIELVAVGNLRPVVSERYSLEQAAEAYAKMRARETFGRVVLTR